MRIVDNGDGSYSWAIAGASGGALSVAGHTAVISASVTRPADTTQYAAGDALTNSTSAPVPLTFNACARANGGSGVMVRVVVIDSANQATAASLELWLFDTIPHADNDNAAFTPTDAECATCLAVIPLNASYVGTATSGADGNRVYVMNGLNIPFKCGAASDDLFGLLVVRNTYTPVSGEVFTVRLGILQD
jgi:hypothetical protein